MEEEIIEEALQLMIDGGDDESLLSEVFAIVQKLLA
jgi:hypothetical protein